MNNSIYNDRLGGSFASYPCRHWEVERQTVRYRRHSRGFQKSPASQREIANLVPKSPAWMPQEVSNWLVNGF